MHGTFLTLAVASILATGCASTITPAALPVKDDVAVKTAHADKAEEAKPAEETKPAEAAPAETAAAPEENTSARKAGDFIVYRFSGSFRKAPMTLTEKVVERRGALLTIDLLADDGTAKSELLIKINEASPTKNDVVSVARVEGGAEKAATMADYEALMAETALAADENEAKLGAEDTTLAFGGAPLAVRKTSYRVRVGKKHATLKTLESDGFAWGDLGGEITAGSKVLYRAEVVDMGHSEPKGSAVADAK